MNTVAPDAPVLAPTTIAELQEAMSVGSRLLPRGGGTKPALSTAPVDTVVLDMRGLAGIQDYEPEEYTLTALAGTPLHEVVAALSAHGQHLPFDPPLVRAGATLGGTVAAGLSGSGRYRYGGVRDFIIGVRLVDGAGRLVRGGGKVVKNAAGFDLPKLMVGSLGRLGVIAELSFKVFPAPPAYATVLAPVPTLDTALSLLDRMRLGSHDLYALDLAPGLAGEGNLTLVVRIGGPAIVLPARLERLRAALGGGDVLTEKADAEWWEAQAEFVWAPADECLVKAPVTPSQLGKLDAALAPAGARRAYVAGGNLAWIAWPGDQAALSSLLVELGLSGLVLRGAADAALIGVPPDRTFLSRIAAALDPSHRFLAL
jgi:glycolate oxidase FAD binding subunit